MNREVRCHRLSESYRGILAHVCREGDEVTSRVGKTKEIVGFRLELDSPIDCVVSREGFNKQLMRLEVRMILAGEFDEDLVRSVTPRAADLVGASTAYGPRIRDQLDACECELMESPDSRRAVVYVGRPNDLISVSMDPDMKGEMPCTETLQFIMRDGLMHLIVGMRSWDLVWGLSYDVPMFVSLQMAMANALGAHVGRYFHQAGSAHVYERHWDMTASENYDRGRLDLGFIDGSIAMTREGAASELRAMRRKMDRAAHHSHAESRR